MLELKGLRFQVEDGVGQTEILRGIDLTIDDNAFVVITGPNGGGKTTLAKTIMGLAKPTGGQIIWNGQDMKFSLKREILLHSMDEGTASALLGIVLICLSARTELE